MLKFTTYKLSKTKCNVKQKSAFNFVHSPSKLFIMLLYSVHSHFIYGIQIWSYRLLQVIWMFSSLNKKLRFALLTVKNINAHSASLFKKSNILPLHMLVDYFQLQFFHRFIINDLPQSFETMYSTWVKNENRRQEKTPLLRNHMDNHIPHSRLTSTEKISP